MERSNQARFFNVKMPGVLTYYKSDDVTTPPQGSIDLRLVLLLDLRVGFCSAEEVTPRFALSGIVVQILSVRNALKKGQVDKARLELELPDRNLIVRARNAEEAQAWQESILAWKDFILDRGVYFPSRGVFDTEGGPNGIPQRVMHGRPIEHKHMANLTVFVVVVVVNINRVQTPTRQQMMMMTMTTMVRSSSTTWRWETRTKTTLVHLLQPTRPVATLLRSTRTYYCLSPCNTCTSTTKHPRLITYRRSPLKQKKCNVPWCIRKRQ